MGLLEAQLPKLLTLHKQDIETASLLLLDGNMPQQSIAVILTVYKHVLGTVTSAGVSLLMLESLVPYTLLSKGTQAQQVVGHTSLPAL